MLKEGLSKLQLPLSKIGRKGSTTESPKEKTSPRSSERSLNQSGENVKGSQLSREGTVRSPRRAERGGGFAGLLSPKNKSETSDKDKDVPPVTVFQSIQMGSVDLVKKLLQTGQSSVNDKHSISGQTPLHFSAAEGQVETAKVLLGHKADLKSKDAWGFTPLHVALLNNHLAMAMFLIKKGADVHALTEKKMTPLHFAVRANYEERDYTAYLAVLDQLLRRGADVNAKNENLETPLYHAVFNARDLGVIFLLLNGADPNLSNKDGMTPLHVACSANKLGIVQALLNYGANPSVRTSQGTPLQEAEKCNNREVVALMFSRCGINTGETTSESDERLSSGHALEEEVKTEVARVEKVVAEFLSSSASGDKDGKETFRVSWLWKKRERGSSDPPLPEPLISPGSGSRLVHHTGAEHRPLSARPSATTEEEEHPLSQAVYLSAEPSEQFTMEKPLGEGAYGQVYSAKHTETGFVVAVKSMIMNPKLKKGIEKEIKILSRCRHPNIVQYYGSYYKSGSVYVIMEYCTAGSSTEYFKVLARPLTEHELAGFFSEVVKGLGYLHKNHFIHRDLKPQNILVSQLGVPKIADFGVSRELDAGQVGMTIVGTPLFSSPEVLEGEPYDYSTDIWSLGITIINVIEGEPPHQEKPLLAAIMAIASSPPPVLKEAGNYSKELNDFLSCCLQKQATDRKKAEQLLEHPFIQRLPQSPEKILLALMNEYKEKKPPDAPPAPTHADVAMAAAAAAAGLNQQQQQPPSPRG